MKYQATWMVQRQKLPLEVKIIMSQNRIREWYNHFNGNVYLSFSGGKDSTVLKHIIENTSGVYDIPCVFVDTGLEYPEIRQFVESRKDNGDKIEIIKPTMSFKQVLKKYGYPVISKEVSRRVQYAKKAIAENRADNHGDYLKLCGLSLDKNGNKSQYNCEKWKFLLDAPFNCSSECCNIIKKNPLKQYEKKTGRVPFIATMASESRLRLEKWVQYGCNSFEAKHKSSQPISFWTKQDILEYIMKYNLDYAPIYGEIVRNKDGTYHTTSVDRTGCMFCMFGCHLEKPENRFQKLAKTHSKLYNYCINGGEVVDDIWQPSKDGLGLGKVLDYIGVNYKPIKNPRKLFELK